MLFFIVQLLLTPRCSGCIFGKEKVPDYALQVINALCNAYQDCNQFAERTRKELFHLRDFVHLMRYLGKKALINTKFDLNPDALLRGLQVYLSLLRAKYNQLI